MLVLDGKTGMVLGDEERIIEPGMRVHIPRNVRHGICALGGAAAFLVVKRSVGTGKPSQDYNEGDDAGEAGKRLSAEKVP